ncbi:MAG TPA: AMP-binding protein [Candidatus Acidoferrales bacterium]|nr:AMP-binding protein [Candidatus Acidoferrales bacterium]
MIYAHSIARAARYYPELVALSVGGRRLSFRELHHRIEQIAAELHRLGFKAGDRLAIHLPNESEYLELIYACSRLGVVVVPLNTRYSTHEIDLVLEDANPRGLVRHSSLPKPGVNLEWQRVLDEEPFENLSGSCPEIFYDPEAVLTLIYTSGTTGRPKGVMLTHANVFSNVHNFNHWMCYKEAGVYLHASPIFHIADFPAMFAAPAFGACQVAIPRFSAQHFCEVIADQRVTHTVLVPTMINLLTQFADIKRYDLNSLEVLAYGGSPIAPEIIRRFREILPEVKLIQVYGLSETGFLTGLRDREHIAKRLQSCGRPCPGIEVQVVDETGTQVESGQRGELVARGANIMRGYWNNERETSAVFRNGFYHTGDLGYQDTAGYFYIVDRIKDMIVTGGEKVFCNEVEAVIYEHPAVREVAVFGIPDQQWGELVAACVVLKPHTTLTKEELVRHCRSRLSPYKIPRHIDFSEAELPKGGSGKILKGILRKHFWAGKQRSVA